MLVQETRFTFELGESGYLIGFTEHDDFPGEMPYGWRCGPAGPSSAVVLTTTDTGPLHLTIQIHDSRPAPEADGAWEPAEEISLQAETGRIHLAVLDPGDVTDAWPQQEPALQLPSPPEQERWMRMRLYCHADDPEPGIGDHGERHLIQLWPEPASTPVHPELNDEDRQARAEYASDVASPVEDYTSQYPLQD
ncbi:hypothetical protein ABZ719_33320 [Streptomyces sp. NPDC006743]|uniref:hypothetical protein n=1 Tax=Streptomyces sp. NPDC006743 TaxID=3154480 RepID=UPI0034512CE8